MICIWTSRKVVHIAVEQITYKNIDPKVRTMTMIGLAFAMLVACFDGTIVGTCAPIIALDLNGMDLYAWMVTAYMLCETIMIPIAGKLSDLYGRKPLFLIGLGLFVAGSLIAGLSVNMEMFIICRAIQGLGGGILIPVAMASVADLYAPRERARIQGILGAIFGIGSAIGPLLGGYITEHISWHWIFYINVPFAVAAFALTIKKFPTPINDGQVSIDTKGIALLTLFLLDILLFFEWGGSEFEWLSLQSILMAVAAIALLAVFIAIEKKAIDPVLNPKLIRNKVVIMAAVFMFIFGIGMMGSMMYSSMFAITVFGLTPLEAGEYSLAMVAGMMITSLSSGALLNKTGYRPWLIAGPIITFASLYLMSTMTVDTDIWSYVLYIFILGFGLGCMSAVVMTAVQNSSPTREMGMTTSAVNLIRSIGATIGTAVFAMIIDGRITSELQSLVPGIFDFIPHDTGVLNIFTDPSYAGILMTPPGFEANVYNIIVAFANSINFAFLAGGLIILSLVIIAIFFKVKKPTELDLDALENQS